MKRSNVEVRVKEHGSVCGVVVIHNTPSGRRVLSGAAYSLLDKDSARATLTAAIDEGLAKVRKPKEVN